MTPEPMVAGEAIFLILFVIIPLWIYQRLQKSQTKRGDKNLY